MLTRTASGKSMNEKVNRHVEFEADSLHWVKLVIQFFELHYMAIIERKKALRIERFFCNIRRMRIRSVFNDFICQSRGYTMSMHKLPSELSLLVLSYLS